LLLALLTVAALFMLRAPSPDGVLP
jgi:hypothetical protein